MNSQFSIGFVIALVIGIAVGALWPKYGDHVRQGAIGLVQDASTVSLAQAGDNHVGRGRGDCGSGSHGKCSGNSTSRGRGGRGGGGCSGDCEESSGNSHGQCGSQQASSRGRGGRAGGGCSGDCEESDRDSHGQCGKGNCEGERSQDKEVAHRRGHRNSGQRKGRRGKAATTSMVSHQPCDHEGQASTCRSQRNAEDSQPTAARSKCAKEGNCEHESATDADDQIVSQHWGPGFGPGFGPGRGFGRGLGLGPGPDWENDLAGDVDDPDKAAN